MLQQDDASSNDDENQYFLEEDADAIDTEEDTEADDYLLFTEMLTEGRKAIVERKRHWEETGDSFILADFSETMRVNEWVKQNLNDTCSANLDISKIYGDMCKKKKLQSTFLEREQEPPKKPTIRKSKSVEPLSPISITAQPMTPSTNSQQDLKRKALSESTHNRRRLSGAGPLHKNPRSLIKSVRRLSTVPESPSAAGKPSPIRRSASIGDMRMPRQRTVIYSPMQPIVEDRFKDVLKRESFDPTKMLVYEPPSDADYSSESGDDIFVVAKRKYGGKIFEI